MKCTTCGKWAGAHVTLPGQPADHLCGCPPKPLPTKHYTTPMDDERVREIVRQELDARLRNVNLSGLIRFGGTTTG